MGFAAQLQAFRDKALSRVDTVTRLTIEEGGGRIVLELSPVGDPLLWKRAPPDGYEPGNFRGNWFYGLDAPSRETHNGIGIKTLNDLERMPAEAGGHKHYISNNLPYAQALEYGHSSQAPVGIVGVIEIELPGIVYAHARKIAA